MDRSVNEKHESLIADDHVPLTGGLSPDYQPPAAPSLFDRLIEIVNDPRNSWIGMGPLAGALKGANLIKPLVKAQQPGYKVAAHNKALDHTGSEAISMIHDYHPELDRTTHPTYGGKSREGIAQTLYYNAPFHQEVPVPTKEEMLAAQALLKKIAQQGAPDMLTLFRGGLPLRSEELAREALPHTPVPVTRDLSTATAFAGNDRYNYNPIFELQVPREDLLADVQKLQRGRGYSEQEVLVPLRSFKGAQTRLPFGNPQPHTDPYFPPQNNEFFKGATFSTPDPPPPPTPKYPVPEPKQTYSGAKFADPLEEIDIPPSTKALNSLIEHSKPPTQQLLKEVEAAWKKYQATHSEADSNAWEALTQKLWEADENAYFKYMETD